jgi:hypothetical protein
MTEIDPPWFMTPRQALEIRRQAVFRGLSVYELVEKVLAKLGTERETRYVSDLLTEQLEWLLDGKPEYAAPYVEKFEATCEDPFTLQFGCGPQVELTVDEFIRAASEEPYQNWEEAMATRAAKRVR